MRLAPCLLLAFAVAACGDDGATSSGSSGGGATTCTPGEQVNCGCPGGAQGVQVCNSEGTALLACNCGGTTASASTATSSASGEATSTGAGGEGASSSDGGGTTTGQGGEGPGGAGGETSAQGGGTSTGQGGTGGEGGGSTTGSGGEDPDATSWLLGFGDAGYDQQTLGVVMRDDGAAIVTVHGRGTFDIGEETYSSVNDRNIAIVTVGADGIVEDVIVIAGTGEAPEYVAVAPLSDGTIVVGGYFCSPTDFGDGVVINEGCDGFLGRYDAGELLEQRIIGGAGDERVVAVAPLEEDVVAILQGVVIDVGNGPQTSENNQYVARLDHGIDAVWVNGFDLSTNAGAAAGIYAVDADPEGGIVIAGDMQNGGADFGDGFLFGPLDRGFVLARYGLDGAPAGSRAEVCGSGALLSLDLDADGNVAAWGRWQGTCELEGIPSSVGSAFFGARFDSANQTVVAFPQAAACNQRVLLDGDGLLLAGYCSGDIDFGSGPTQPNGDDLDFVTVRYDDLGDVQEVVRYGPVGGGSDYAVRGPNGELGISGRTCDDIDLGFGSMEHKGNCDAWVARIDDP